MNDSTYRGASRVLASTACGLTALLGGLLAIARLIRVVYFPLRELGGLALFWLAALAIPLQLVPLTGAVWSALIWRARAFSRLGCVLLALWAFLSLVAFALGLLTLPVRD